MKNSFAFELCFTAAFHAPCVAAAQFRGAPAAAHASRLGCGASCRKSPSEAFLLQPCPLFCDLLAGAVSRTHPIFLVEILSMSFVSRVILCTFHSNSWSDLPDLFNAFGSISRRKSLLLSAAPTSIFSSPPMQISLVYISASAFLFYARLLRARARAQKLAPAFLRFRFPRTTLQEPLVR